MYFEDYWRAKFSQALSVFFDVETSEVDSFNTVQEHFYASCNSSVSFTPNITLIDDLTDIPVTIIAAEQSFTPRTKTANLINVSFRTEIILDQKHFSSQLITKVKVQKMKPD